MSKVWSIQGYLVNGDPKVNRKLVIAPTEKEAIALLTEEMTKDGLVWITKAIMPVECDPYYAANGEASKEYWRKQPLPARIDNRLYNIKKRVNKWRKNYESR